MNTIKEKWIKELGYPEEKITVNELILTNKYECDDFIVEMYNLKKHPTGEMRVSLAIPKNLKTPAPAVIVPFYHAENMLGINHENGEMHERYGKYPIMADLAKRGYITISADAYPYQYISLDKEKNYKGFGVWECAAKLLKEEHPHLMGIGRLTYDTMLLCDVLCNDNRVNSEKIGIMGHSLGGKMAFYTGCLDERIKVIVASDFGIGWDQTNWQDIWYWGDYVNVLKEKGMEHSELLGASPRIPFCLIAGEFDNDDSWKMMLKAKDYEKDDERLKIINHATGHTPPKDALEEAYCFIDKFLN